MSKSEFHTIDLNFQNTPRSIASYLIQHQDGGILIESGPGSTVNNLIDRLAEHHLTPADITDVLLTHIHLDHAGAAGWLARQGAHIHVHHIGAPHMLDPEKLIASAARIYGDMMDELWGDFLPVPEDKLHILHDNDEITIGEWNFRALDTPGHAYHHMAFALDGICFSGDVGGVRIPHPGNHYIQVPMPPPGLHLEKWRDSIHRLQEENFHTLVPTHFGFYSDVDAHLKAILDTISRTEAWMTEMMEAEPTLDTLREKFLYWTHQQAELTGIDKTSFASYDKANPPTMSADGLYRYWNKVIMKNQE
jgi:glyoxylase-like metal-dependent hydrolase (beta-lactamase superfamily II)